MRPLGRGTGDDRGDDGQRPGRGISLTAFAALLAAVASTAGILYQIWPEHHFRATMTVLSVEKNVSYAAYLDRLNVKSGEQRGHANQGGNVFYLRAQIEDVDRSSLSLVSYVFTTPSDKRILRWEQQSPPIFSPGTSISRQIGRAWVPFPRASGRYYVRFELYGDEALLAYTNSPVFSIESF
jgi:hypothetical protein